MDCQLVSEQELPEPAQAARVKEVTRGHCRARLLVAIVTLAGAGLAAFVCRPVGPSLTRLRPKLQVQLSEAGDGRAAEDACAEYPYLKIGKLIHNNLAGLGPNSSGPEGMAYELVELGEGSGAWFNRGLIMTFNATSDAYHPFSPRMNGQNGQYATLNMKPGSEVTVEVRWYDKLTRAPVTLNKLAWSFFDLDEGHNGQGQESVKIHKGFRDWHITENSEVQVTEHDDGSATFASSTYGNGTDNPYDPAFLTPQQFNRAVTVLYQDIESLTFTVRAASGTLPRFFTFCARPSLMCAVEVEEHFRPPLPALDFTPPDEIPVMRPTGCKSFSKWLVEEGHHVSKNEAIGEVTLEDGSTKQLLAPATGSIKALAGLQPGEDPKTRLSDGVVAVVTLPEVQPVDESIQEQHPPLPALDAPPEQVPVNKGPADAIFDRWVTNVGHDVHKGDPVALTTSKDGKPQFVAASATGKIVAQQPLQRGETIDIRLTDKTIALIKPPTEKEEAPLPPLTKTADTDATLDVKGPGQTFHHWMVQVGDMVKEGDGMAVALNRDDSEHVYTAPKKGKVVKLQPLQKGDDMDKALESGAGLAVIETVQEVVNPYPDLKWNEHLEVPLMVDHGQHETFSRWFREVPTTVRVGDPIAETVRTDGSTRTYEAPADGFLVKRQERLEKGDNLDQLVHNHAIAVVRLPQDTYSPLPNLGFTPPSEVPVRAARGAEIFHRWDVTEGDVVQQGEVVAETLLLDGSLHAHRAPVAGVVLKTQALKAGDRLDLRLEDHVMAVLKTAASTLEDHSGSPSGDAPKLPDLRADLPGEVRVRATHPPEKFHRWEVNVGNMVKPGDVIAETLLEDGTLQVYEAPIPGVVMGIQPLQPGKPVEQQLWDNTIAVLGPREDMQTKLTALGYTPPDEVPLHAQGGGEFFGGWLASVGDLVSRDEHVAEAWLKDGSVRIYTAPHSGTLVRALPLQVGDFMDTKLSTSVIAVVRVPPVLSPLLVGDGELPVKVQFDVPQKFHSWSAAVGDTLEKDAPVATVLKSDGTPRIVTAPAAGVLVRMQPVLPGEDVESRLPDAVLAVVQTQPGKDPLPELHAKSPEVSVKAGEGEKFERYLAAVGQKVSKDDPLAETLLQDGTRHTYRCPQSGLVVSEQPLKKGDDLDTKLPGRVFAVIKPLQDRLEDLTIDPETGFLVKAAGGPETLHRWRVNVGQPVGAGDPVVETLKSGALKIYTSPEPGLVMQIQPLRQGDDIGELLEQGTLAAIKRPTTSSRSSSVDPLPKLDCTPPNEVCVKAAPEQERFLRLVAGVGTLVQEGDPVLETLRPDGIMHTYKASDDGLVVRAQPLQPGDSVDDLVPDGVLAVVSVSKHDLPRLPPLPFNPDIDVAVQASGGHVKFLDWLVPTGTKVKKSQAVAQVLKEDNTLLSYTSEADGTLLRIQPLQEGEYVDERLPDNVAAVVRTHLPKMVASGEEDNLLPLAPLQYTPPFEVPLIVRHHQLGEKFERWVVGIGEAVTKGQKMADVLTKAGKTSHLHAPASGVVVRMLPLRPGEHMGHRMDSNAVAAVIRVWQDTLPPLPALRFEPPKEVPVAGPHGQQKFVRWLAKVGDVAHKGDPVAEASHQDGSLHVYRAPESGAVTQLQSLQGGDDMDQRLPDDNIAIIRIEDVEDVVSSEEGKLPALEVHPPEIPVKLVPKGAHFLRYVVHIGDVVKKDDPIAELLLKDKQLYVLKAPAGGMVVRAQPLQQGEEVDKMLPDTTIAVMRPGDSGLFNTNAGGDETAFSPLSHGGDREVPLHDGGAATFDRWLVKAGEMVTQDQSIGQALEDGKLHPLKAPVTGLLTKLHPFQTGHKMADSMAPDSDVVAVVKMRALDRANHVGIDLGTSQLPSLGAPSPLEVPLKVDGGGTFHRWTATLGSQVVEGQDIGESVMPDGSLKAHKAPATGTLTALQPLQEGDNVDTKLPDDVIAFVKKPALELTPRLPPLPVGLFEAPANADLDSRPHFHRWNFNVGSEVVKGDTIGEVVTGGDKVVPIRAPHSGTITKLQPLQQGDDLNAKLTNASVAVVKMPQPASAAGTPLPAIECGEHEVPVSSKPEEKTFQRYLVTVGDVVSAGDPVVEFTTGDGKVSTQTAVKTGVVSQLLPLKPGDDLEGRLTTPVVAAIRSPEEDNKLLPKLHLGPYEVPIDSESGGETFQSLRANVGSSVEKGDAIADTILKDGTLKTYIAPARGVVVKAQPLQTGDRIDTTIEDKTMVVVKVPASESSESADVPKLPKLIWSPPLQVPAELPPKHATFQSWSVNVGDPVLKGDPLAQIILEDGKPGVCTAPASGLVIKLQDLAAGDDLQAVLADPNIAVVKTPMTTDSKDVPVVAGTGEKVLSLVKQVGEPIKAGEVLAVVQKPGQPAKHIVAPNGGVLAKANPELAPGKTVDSSVSDATLGVIKPLTIPVLTDDKPNQIWKSFSMEGGEEVKQGDVIGQTIVDGGLAPVKAPISGTVVHLSRSLVPGTDVEGEVVAAEIMPTEGEVPIMKTEEKQTFIHWHALPGDVVQLGETLVATQYDEGKELHKYLSPVRGVIASVHPALKPLTPMGPEHRQMMMVKPLVADVPLKALDGETVKTPPNVHPGDKVKQGDWIGAMKGPDGSVRDILAPMDGTVVTVQPGLHGGAPVPGGTLCTVKAEDDLLPVLVHPGDTFVGWHKAVGDSVRMDDVIAVSKGTDQQTHEYKSPVSGVVVAHGRDMKPGKVIAPQLRDQAVAMVRPLNAMVKMKAVAGESHQQFQAEALGLEPVKAGSVMAVLQRPDGGGEHQMRAPIDGIVYQQRADLETGEVVGDDMEDKTIFAVHPLMSEMPQLLEGGGETFSEFTVQTGQLVQSGETIAHTKLPDGSTKAYKANVNGIVAKLHPGLKPGRVIDDTVIDKNILVIIPQGSVVPVFADDGETVKETKVSEGTKVTRGDVIAVAELPGGEIHTYKAPVDGVVKKVNDQVRPGTEIDDKVYDKAFVKIEPAGGSVPVSALPKEVFKTWHVKEGQEVQPGDKLAVTTRPDGRTHEYHVPVAGTVVIRHPGLEPGTKLDFSVSDKTLAVIQPSDGPLHFQTYEQAIGDVVLKGDPLVRGTDLFGAIKTVTAPQNGVITALLPLRPEDPFKPNEPSGPVSLGPIPGATEDTPAMAQPHTIFKEFVKEPLDAVTKGDVIAHLGKDTGSEVIEVLSPATGVIKSFKEGLKPGVDIDEVCPDQEIAIIGKLDPLAVRHNDDVIGAPDPGMAFEEWLIDEGSYVQEGDPVVKLSKSDGDAVTISSHATGQAVQLRGPMKPGYELDDVMDGSGLAVIRPVVSGDTLVPVDAPPQATFAGWTVVDGAAVNAGDTVATVHVPTGEGERTETLQVVAAASGHVVVHRNEQGEQPVGQVQVALVDTTESGWPLWLKTLLWTLPLCCCCCLVCVGHQTRKHPVYGYEKLTITKRITTTVTYDYTEATSSRTPR